MTWEEFVAVVDSHLAVEANRRGLATFRDRYMKNAVLDLQAHIRGYREANKSVFSVGDVSVQGHAHLVPMPTEALPKAAYIYSVATDASAFCPRHRLSYYKWEKKDDLLCGRLNFLDWWGCCWPEGGCPPASESDCTNWEKRAYVYTVSPMARNFLVYPQLTASTRLLLVFDGYKTTFSSDDEVVFPIRAAEAVASYVLWKICANVDKRPDLAALHAADYSRLRLSLWRDFQESVEGMDAKDQEFDSTLIMPSDPFYGFGKQEIPFLAIVTELEGVTNAALANLPTTQITTPYVLQVEISGELQTWVLMTSTAANAPSDGVLRPNDFDASTNPRVFFQNSI